MNRVRMAGLKMVYRLSQNRHFNRAADWLGNTLHKARINYALGATRSKAKLFCAKSAEEYKDALRTLRKITNGEIYLKGPMLYREDYEPPRGELVGGVGFMNNHGILEMYQTYFVGRRPQLVSSILKEAKQAGHLIAAPKEFPTNAETLDKALTKMIKNIAELQKQMSQGKALKQFYLEHDIGPVPETSTGVSPWSRLAEDSAAPTGNGGPKGRSPKSLLIKDDAYPYGEHADEGGKWGAFYKGK